MAEHFVGNPVWPAAAAMALVCVSIWTWFAVQWRRGRPVVRWQPRRASPWTGGELIVVVAIYFMLQWLLGALGHWVLPAEAWQPDVNATSAVHPLARLVAHGNLWILALGVVSAVAVTPLFEELLFRVLFQGWLESLWHGRRRRRWRRAGMPIFVSSLVFAAMHFRSAGPAMTPQLAAFLFAGDAVVKILTAAMAIVLVRRATGADAADLGWSPRTWAGDVRLGLILLAAVAPLIYALQIGLGWVLPSGVAPDPVPLLFFGLVLGTLWFRTHRLLPPVVLHAAFNAVSLLLAWLGGL
ncbi:MAG: CPBP family intramembrane metalloprotease [Planctomycetaceae bacterium]|nr:CPBP family intramembrane metalloprotease [Planctomycetaceae bacterium]